MPVYSHRSDQQSQQAPEGATAQGLADFGSNVERTDEVEKQSVQPTWFEEVMSLVGKTTDEVYAEQGAGAASAVAESTPEATPVWATEEDDATYAPKGKMGSVHAKHTERLADGIELDLGMRERDLEIFVAHYAKHRARYESVSAKTNIPAKLIAALHWRESTGSFKHYLHQGDPIGKPSRNVPRGVLFYDWETAAIDALSDKSSIRDNVGMTAETTDTAAIASFSEAYNGLGYHNKGKPSPYVYAGTSEYSAGKYVRDGVYSSRAVDQQLGVLPMVGALGGLETPITEADRNTEWAKVLAGKTTLRRGSRGLAVEALQERLTAAGFRTGIDGSFGPGTKQVVMDWQVAQGLTADGVIGKESAAKFDGTSAPAPKADAPATVATPAAPESGRDAAWAGVVAGSIVLRRGSRGPAVEALQERLNAAGFRTDIDGSFGPATRRQVLACQQANGLDIDGVVGRGTSAALA